jgi:hypothetical protein
MWSSEVFLEVDLVAERDPVLPHLGDLGFQRLPAPLHGARMEGNDAEAGG